MRAPSPGWPLRGKLGSLRSDTTCPTVTPQHGGYPAAVTMVHTLIKGELQESRKPAINSTQAHKMQSWKNSIKYVENRNVSLRQFQGQNA